VCQEQLTIGMKHTHVSDSMWPKERVVWANMIGKLSANETVETSVASTCLPIDCLVSDNFLTGHSNFTVSNSKDRKLESRHTLASTGHRAKYRCNNFSFPIHLR
jgi:hypothetical protein